MLRFLKLRLFSLPGSEGLATQLRLPPVTLSSRSHRLLHWRAGSV
jgi:hypothetical protein